ncbi:replication initiator protein A [Paracoccus mutanolyticus]|uniref:replication initiator protein A n=1 Tax=Paracoccus mutanolyticus TaxID=1499308 RepID=UPI001CB944F4|nr:replication initiator protein A [Paracoccus mutanolyticus]
MKAALARLQSTVIATTIRNGPHWRRRQFSWINEWEELTTRSGRVEGMEFVLPEWLKATASSTARWSCRTSGLTGPVGRPLQIICPQCRIAAIGGARGSVRQRRLDVIAAGCDAITPAAWDEMLSDIAPSERVSS